MLTGILNKHDNKGPSLLLENINFKSQLTFGVNNENQTVFRKI